jgi:serine/threonine protein kinase
LNIFQNKVIGLGHYGEVYFGTVFCKRTHRRLPVAAKMANIDDNFDFVDDERNQNGTIESSPFINALRIELNVLAYLQRLNAPTHPNLIRLIGTMTIDTNEFYLLTEYCEYGSVERYLQEIYKKNRFVNEIDSRPQNHIDTANLLVRFYFAIACFRQFKAFIVHHFVGIKQFT